MARRKRKRRTSDPARFSKKVIAAVLFAVAAFTVTMIVVFWRKGAVPDTLVTAFFAFAGGEAGVLGLIRFGKAKYDPGNTPPSNSDAGGTDTPAG